MAKGNMFLGQSRGSVGDVTFYQSSGQQISRARNRNPRNPRSNRQLLQRAIAATVMQAYSAGKEIFDHSFEGLQVPAKAMWRFNSANMVKLRQAFAEDFVNYESNDFQPTAFAVGPKANSPIFNAYRISEGSLSLSGWDFRNSPSAAARYGVEFEHLKPGMLVKDVLNALNWEVGDIFTFVAFAVVKPNIWASVEGRFGYIRLTVIDDNLEEVAVNDEGEYVLPWGSYFKIESPSANVNDIADTNLEDSIGVSSIVLSAEEGSIGLIRSREDSGLRSTSDMILSGEYLYGLTARNVVKTWRQDNQGILSSELILEGAQV